MTAKHLRKEKPKTQPPKVQEALDAFSQVSPTDPLGMYTAQPRIPDARPVQDQDDL